MRKNRGFTLIELIVVIIILGVLAVTAAPKFVDVSADARIAVVKAEATALKSALNLARNKWLLLGSPSDKDSRNDVQLWGSGEDGQIDFNVQGWPAQSYSGSDQVLTADSADDCLSLYIALIEGGAAKADRSDTKTYQVTHPGDCAYTLVADNSLGFYYNPLTGSVTLF